MTFALFGSMVAVLVFAIVGMAIEKHYHDRKGDNGMRRRMTDRKDVLPAPDRNCRRFGEEWERHAPQATKRRL